MALAGVLVAWRTGGVAVDAPWIPSWDARLTFEVDGLAALYGVVAAGVGAAVFLYASAYVPAHLAHEGRAAREERRFHALMVLFLVSMLGLATAQDLLVLFVFWDLTAITSYLLIGFDRHQSEARASALMALLVTGVSAVLLLIGFLALRSRYGTTSIPELAQRVEPGTPLTLAAALIAVGALAKSAQVPLHFWLPRAMAAPTPVSAYLHSAAMVAAGVLLLSRLHTVIAPSGAVLDGLLVVGLASMGVGGVLALAATGLKQLLAYSTIAQYGYVVAMLGVGGKAGAAAACFYVLAHAAAKSALFLTAGAVTEATGAKELGQTGGLARRMPLLAAGSAAAAAGLAALPLTVGFFKDELFFKAAAERGTWLAVLAVAGAALTLAYAARFWGGLFLGAPRGEVREIPRRLVWPVAGLGALVVAGGIAPGPFAELAADAARDTAGVAAPVDVAYHLDARTENVMALATYALGLVLVAGRRLLEVGARLVHRVGAAVGPDRVYVASLLWLDKVSDSLHDLEVRDLRARVAAVLFPAAVLVAIGVAVTPTEGAYDAGIVTDDDLPLVFTLAVCALAAVATTRPRRHLALVLALSAVGFALAVAYALVGAPDVALVAVLVETIFALLFLAIFSLVPRDVLRREAALPTSRNRRIRDPIVGIFSGFVAFLVVWGALSRPTPQDGMAQRHLELAEEAHGKDVVTVILADFRGLDTFVEITVVLVALLGVAGLLRRGRLW